MADVDVMGVGDVMAFGDVTGLDVTGVTTPGIGGENINVGTLKLPSI